VFDVSQTEGEPLPELETEATGMPKTWFPVLLGAADNLDVEVRIVDAADWEHGSAKGVCKYRVSVIFTQSSRRKPARIRPIRRDAHPRVRARAAPFRRRRRDRAVET